MAYINQDKKKKIAEGLKKILKGSGIKYSLAIRNHSTLIMTIKSAPIDFIKNYNETCGSRYGYDKLGFQKAETYLNVNPYWFHEHFDGVAKDYLQKIFDTIRGEGEWYDRSDIQSDYFDTAFYIDVDVGKWNKPFQVTA